MHVCIYIRCIKGHLCKLGKIVVLVTHQLQYVSECDTVLALKDVSNCHYININIIMLLFIFVYAL